MTVQLPSLAEEVPGRLKGVVDMRISENNRLNYSNLTPHSTIQKIVDLFF